MWSGHGRGGSRAANAARGGGVHRDHRLRRHASRHHHRPRSSPKGRGEPALVPAAIGVAGAFRAMDHESLSRADPARLHRVRLAAARRGTRAGGGAPRPHRHLGAEPARFPEAARARRRHAAGAPHAVRQRRRRAPRASPGPGQRQGRRQHAARRRCPATRARAGPRRNQHHRALPCRRRALPLPGRRSARNHRRLPAPHAAAPRPPARVDRRRRDARQLRRPRAALPRRPAPFSGHAQDGGSVQAGLRERFVTDSLGA